MARSYTARPSAICYLDGKLWRGAKKFTYHQKFKEQIETGTVEGRDPPTPPRAGMEIRWAWGYDGVNLAGFRGYVSDANVASYPHTDSVQCAGVLWLADQNSEVLQTDPLNDIKASDAAKYLLTHYGDIPLSRLNLPVLPASGAAWVGSEWTLGKLTPVQWGDVDQQSGGTTSMKAAAEIYGALGFWLYATYSGTVTAKQMERRPSTTAREVFERDVNLLVRGSPERRQSYNDVYNQVTVRGANTGVDGAQLYDQWRTTSPILRAGIYKDFPYSSFLLEYENAADAGNASITSVAQRILKVVSRVPDVVPLRVKADPRRAVGDTVGIIDIGIRIPTQKNYFIYDLTRTLDLDTGDFSDQLLLDGGIGNSGFTTVPPPDASFSWELMRETLDGVDVVEVALDGSGSNSPTGDIVSWAWSTSTTTYGGTPNSATGETATLIFEAADSPADITLVVTDTTSKTGEFEASVDLTGADTRPPFQEVVSGAAGAAWYVTPDGGGTWNVETANGDAVAVGTIGAGADDRATGTAGTYGLLATRGSGGAGGLRQTLDTLATASANLVSNSGAITSNIWVNEANPARVWFAIGTAVYRSIDGGATKVAMHAAPDDVTWIMEDPEVENSIFLLAGADMLNATDPTVGYALLYPGPIGATARQFVRSRDGQVTWVCYIGAPAGEALQRVESGAAADIAATDIRSLALDRQASSLRATVYAVTADDPAQLWSFDGLTGLSAVQSSQTFPSGATVQHMLSSREFDVIYCADFDSVALGTGAWRKYFPQPDLLLLWKALATGQQGHMLGLGARVASPAELLWMTAGLDPAGVWHRQADGTLVFRPLPISGVATGHWFAADPFNVDRWLTIWNTNSPALTDSSGTLHGDGWAHSPLWKTDDAGVTWTEVPIPTPPGFVAGSLMDRLTFSDQTANTWAVVLVNGGTFYTAVVLGAANAVTSTVESTAFSAPGIAAGADGETLLVQTFGAPFTLDYLRYLDTSNTLQIAAGSSPGDLERGFDRLPANDRGVVIADGTIFGTTDYRATQPISLVTGLNASSTAAALSCVYAANGDGSLLTNKLYRVFDIFGTPAATDISNGYHFHGHVRVDRQTRTHAAIRTIDSTGALIDDGVTTQYVAGPPVAEAELAFLIDVIVRV